MNKNIWSLKLSTASLVLIPAAVGINYIGKMFASILKLPLWLDAIGTVLAAMLGGPIVGAITGAINNIIYGLTMDPMSFVYALTNIAIGLVVGVLAAKGWVKTLPKAIVTGVVIALVATLVSTPINIALWGGQTGNVWGDGIFAIMTASGMPVWISSLVDEFVVDFFDKIATVLIAFAIFKGLPKNMTAMFNNSGRIEKL